MRNFLKKCLSLVLVVILAVGIVGTYLPGASAEVEATDTAETPKYMAKIIPTSNGEYDRVGQRVSNVKAGNKYNISYKAYVIETGTLELHADESATVAAAKGNSGSFVDGIGSCTVTESQETKGFIYFNFQCWSGAFYVWDVKITLDGGDGTNLLTNPDWSQNSGSWMNWIFSGYNGGYYKMTNTLAKSHAYENTSGRKVILYNEDLFSLDVKNREQAETSGDPAYMAKIPNKQRIEQTISVPAIENDTYILSFSHYNLAASNFQLRLGYKIDDTTTKKEDGATYKYVSIYNNSSNQTIQTTSISYLLNEGEDSLVVRIEATGGSAQGYVWGLSLTKQGGDGTNLLKNANFCDGGGSWIGWNVSGKGDIKTVAQSEEAETDKNCPIVAYNPNVLNSTNTDIALWSVQPILEESLDLNYKTTLTSTPDATPTMTFVMTNGDETVKQSTVTGTEIGTNKYSFSYTVLPQHMANTITATLTVAVSGVETTETKTYSVKQYCGTLLSYDDNSAYMKDLIADLMRYGAQTQAAFGKADSITSGLTSFMSGYGSSAALANADYLTTLISGDNANATYKWKSASLVLDGKVTIRLKFTTEDVSTLKVKVNDEAYDIKTADGYYYVDIPMSAIAFDDTVTANFYEGEATDATGATLSYSVNTYLYRKRNGNEKNLLESIYKYGQSAEVYNEYIVNGTISTLDNDISDDWSL